MSRVYTILTKRKKYFQILVALSANWGTINTGLVFGYTAVSLPQLKLPHSRILVNRHQASWIGEFKTKARIARIRLPNEFFISFSQRVGYWDSVRMHTCRLSHRPVGSQKDVNRLTAARHNRVDDGRSRHVGGMDLRGQIPSRSQFRNGRSSVQSVHGRSVATARPRHVGRVRVSRNVYG